MRKIIIAFFVLISFGLFNTAEADQASLSISGAGSKKIGSTFTMTANLNSGGNKICAISFDIEYPADKLELKNNSLGTVFTMATEHSVTEGKIHYQLGAAGCSTNNATLLNMSFKAKAQGDATVRFSSSDLSGGDDGLATISAVNGSAIIKIPAPSTTTSTSSQPSPIEAPVKDPALTKVEYSAEATLDNSQNKAKGIIFSGTADPNYKINILINSDPISATSQSDATGIWTYTLNEWLSSGLHKITLTSENNGKKSNEITTDFVIGTESKNQIAIGSVLPVAEAAPVTTVTTSPSENKINLTTIEIIAGGTILLLAIILIIIFSIKRKKYLKVANDISISMADKKQNQPLSMPEEKKEVIDFESNYKQQIPPTQLNQSVQNTEVSNLRENIPDISGSNNFQAPLNTLDKNQTPAVNHQKTSGKILDVKEDRGDGTMSYTANAESKSSIYGDFQKNAEQNENIVEEGKLKKETRLGSNIDLNGEPEITFDNNLDNLNNSQK